MSFYPPLQAEREGTLCAKRVVGRGRHEIGGTADAPLMWPMCAHWRYRYQMCVCASACQEICSVLDPPTPRFEAEPFCRIVKSLKPRQEQPRNARGYANAHVFQSCAPVWFSASSTSNVGSMCPHNLLSSPWKQRTCSGCLCVDANDVLQLRYLSVTNRGKLSRSKVSPLNFRQRLVLNASKEKRSLFRFS